MSNDTLFECTICGKIGSVGRCCGDDTRRPLNDAAKMEVDRIASLEAKSERVTVERDRLKAKIAELEAILRECASELTASVEAEYPMETRYYNDVARRFARDMDIVDRVNKLLAIPAPTPAGIIYSDVCDPIDFPESVEEDVERRR